MGKNTTVPGGQHCAQDATVGFRRLGAATPLMAAGFRPLTWDIGAASRSRFAVGGSVKGPSTRPREQWRASAFAPRYQTWTFAPFPLSRPVTARGTAGLDDFISMTRWIRLPGRRSGRRNVTEEFR